MKSENENNEEASLQDEIRAERKFSMEEAIARETKGIFKGVSLVPPLTRAQIEISQFLGANLRDLSGVLVRTLELRLKENDSLLGSHLEDPLTALGIEITRILSSDSRLHEFVRQVDQRSGRMFQERPHFQRPGEEPHPDDEYTHASVRVALQDLAAKLAPR